MSTTSESEMEDSEIRTIAHFIHELDEVYELNQSNWDEKRAAIENLLHRINLSTDEVNKYTFWDSGERPYTRNLIHTDGKNYTLLMLCWNGGRESSIHDHPCEGCFIRAIRGSVRETRYEVLPEVDQIKKSQITFLNEGQVSYMHDSIGLHKIGNPCKNTGSVTLHLYTPPFKSCRVWSDADRLSSARIAKPGYFSVGGHRSANMEAERWDFLKDIRSHAASFHSRFSQNIEI
jgi:cysteine dioxygenase